MVDKTATDEQALVAEALRRMKANHSAIPAEKVPSS